MVIGALLGLIGSIIPEILKLYKDWSDKKHEKEMYELMMKYAELEAKLKVEEARALAELELDKVVYEYAQPRIVPTGYWLADTLQAIGNFVNMIVRPIITFSAFFLWLIGMYSGYQFSEWESNVLTCIITFWFGNRSFQRAFGRIL